ncbi:MAG: sulfotransferase domain-containing protein [candidate division KSB1 bacterium]|nr:sulfotransferase domain-containing protein [candidate division KSB1 bacterium]MDZ7301505.1 sulfotransferase domain-containing protein [candidate division KSB1 bacterium]MDZ7310907.1 sulfotransferase domain-containing protein [candidate division KSB1 bacterium]
MEKPSIWVVGYPRSGNTWVSYLCSYVLNLPFFDFDAPGKRPKQEWVDRALRGRRDRESPEAYYAVQKTHKLPQQVPFANGIVLYIQRDPRDVFVSYSYYIAHVAPTLRNQIKHKVLRWLGRKRQIKWFIADWKRHVRAWQQHAGAIMHYENLLAEGEGYLARCLQSLGLHPAPEMVREALQTFRFENMTGGRTRGNEDNKSFFRRGVAGDWRNHLTAEDSELLQQAQLQVMSGRP